MFLLSYRVSSIFIQFDFCDKIVNRNRYYFIANVYILTFQSLEVRGAQLGKAGAQNQEFLTVITKKCKELLRIEKHRCSPLSVSINVFAEDALKKSISSFPFSFYVHL